MKTYKIYTLGCKVNQYDSGSLAAELDSAGFVITKNKADLAVVNSCAVTKTAIIKSGRMVKLARKENPKAKIVLAGCWPRVYKIKPDNADYVIGSNKIGELINKIFDYKLRITDKMAKAGSTGLAATDRARYFIKIQDGCEQYCSYCIVPYTRGKLKSRREEEIICEIEQAVKAGYSEIVLSGIHLGLYGQDNKKHNKNNLVGLLKKIIKINGLGRVRLSSIEITEVSDGLIKLMAKEKKICQHLYIPLQSGSDKILKLMNRPYTKKYFLDKIKKIRRAMPDIAITADVIVGFPGETKKDFKETKKFIKQIKFSRLHIFPFSAHEKTAAAKFPAQVDEKIKTHRAKILRELSVKLMSDYKKKFKGRELEIVIEQIKQNNIIGKTEYYFNVEVEKRRIVSSKINENKKLIGKIFRIKNN